MNKRIFVFIVVIIQLLFLSSMIWFHQNKLAKAIRVMLKTVPIDPVGAFRGRYVSLRYEISSLPIGLLRDIKPNNLSGGDIVFVKLKKEGEYWQAEGVYRNLTKDNRGVYLRGRLRNYYGYGYISQAKEIPVEYGIESFFLNEKAADVVDRSYRQLGNWQDINRMRKQRIAQLDIEIQRIHKANITKWWFNTLKNELDSWLKDGLIDQKTKDSIYNKYTSALDKISQIEKEINPSSSPNQKQIIVEIAIDSNGNGYPTRLFCDGKIYK